MMGLRKPDVAAFALVNNKFLSLYAAQGYTS